MKRAIFFYLMAAGLLFQTSCVTPGSTQKPAQPAVSEKKKEEHVVFRSDEYIVCLLKGRETSAALAKRFLGDDKKSWIIEDSNEGIAFEKGQVIVIPLIEENKGGLAEDGYQVVPILCYHQFSEKCGSPTCMPTNLFEQQMKYLKDNGYRVITLSSLHDFLKYRHALPRRSVVISIDDGYKSVYDIACPILKKYGFKATLFVYTDFIGIGSGAMTWKQLRELKEDGFEVGSHTISHCDLTKKKKGEDNKAYMARIRKELLESKRIIDENVGQDTFSIAFPYGNCNQQVLKLSEELGYKIGLTVKGGGNPFFTDPLVLKRNQVLKRDMESFTALLKTFKELSLR